MPFIHHRPRHIEGCSQSPEPSSCYICPLLVECRVFFDEFEHISPETLANMIRDKISQPQLGHSAEYHRQPRRSNIIYMFEAKYPPNEIKRTDLAYIFTRDEINKLLARRQQNLKSLKK